MGLIPGRGTKIPHGAHGVAKQFFYKRKHSPLPSRPGTQLPELQCPRQLASLPPGCRPHEYARKGSHFRSGFFASLSSGLNLTIPLGCGTEVQSNRQDRKEGPAALGT